MIKFQLRKEDLDMFEALESSGIAKHLATYLARLGDHLCDARTVDNPFSDAGQKQLAAQLVATKILEEYLFRPMKVRDEKKINDTNEYE